MSLVSFHRSLILTAIVFCFLYAGWELRSWLTGDGTGAPILAGVFATLGLTLVVYLARLSRILKLED
jgi:hypothetical protein